MRKETKNTAEFPRKYGKQASEKNVKRGKKNHSSIYFWQELFSNSNAVMAFLQEKKKKKKALGTIFVLQFFKNILLVTTI